MPPAARVLGRRREASVTCSCASSSTTIIAADGSVSLSCSNRSPRRQLNIRKRVRAADQLSTRQS